LISWVGLPCSGFSLWCKEFPLCNQIFVLSVFTALHIWLSVGCGCLESNYFYLISERVHSV
jgi:hypothetical protein